MAEHDLAMVVTAFSQQNYLKAALLTLVLLALTAISWAGKKRLVGDVMSSATGIVRWRSARRSPRDVALPEWVGLWLVACGCRLNAHNALAGVSRARVEQRFGIRVPDVVMDQPTADELREKPPTGAATLGREWPAYRMASTRDGVVATGLTIGVLTALLIGTVLLGTAAGGRSGTPDWVALLSVAGFATALFVVPIACLIRATRRMGVLTFGPEGAVLRSAKRQTPIDLRSVVIALSHRSEASFTLTATNTPRVVQNAVITPSPTTPALRVPADDMRHLLADVLAGHAGNAARTET